MTDFMQTWYGTVTFHKSETNTNDKNSNARNREEEYTL